MLAKFSRRGALVATLSAFMATSLPAYAADLKVGANVGNVPWEFQNEKGEIVGFEIDLAQEVGKRLNMNVSIVNIPFNGLFAAVQSGQIDAAVSSITITKKRLESVSFAQPYYDSDQSLAVRADSPVKDLATMSGKVAAVDTGSTGDMWATQTRRSTNSRISVALKVCRRPCSISQRVASMAISATSRRSNTTSKTSRATRLSNGSRRASNTQ